jgi:hypothetical protein
VLRLRLSCSRPLWRRADRAVTQARGAGNGIRTPGFPGGSITHSAQPCSGLAQARSGVAPTEA